jgi:hypothetical protein
VDQQATVNTPVPSLPTVRAEDQYGNPVNSAAIVFTIVQGNGSLLGAQQSSNSLGVATVGAWTIGTAIGQQIVTATATGAQPAVFSVNALAGPPVGPRSRRQSGWGCKPQHFHPAWRPRRRCVRESGGQRPSHFHARPEFRHRNR